MKCYIIADPNGAGKTTFADAFLPEEASCLNFVNADLIGKRGRYPLMFNENKGSVRMPSSMISLAG